MDGQIGVVIAHNRRAQVPRSVGQLVGLPGPPRVVSLRASQDATPGAAGERRWTPPRVDARAAPWDGPRRWAPGRRCVG